MDLVVGATGHVGSAVARRLAEGGRRVRALVRNPEGREEAARLAAAGVQVVDGDLTRPGTLARACEGVQTVVCTATTMPHGRDDGLRRVDRDGVLALIDAAEAAGVKRFVYVSYSGNLERPSPLHEAKRRCERRLADTSMRSVILRPSCFMEVWLSPLAGFDPAGGTVRLFGSGETPMSYISLGNVVDFAVAAVEREFDRDEVLELGGPEPVSQLQAARIFERELGRAFEIQHVPVETLEAQHASDDPVQRTFAALMLGVADGDPIPDAEDTAERFGVSLVSVEDYARRVAAGAGSGEPAVHAERPRTRGT